MAAPLPRVTVWAWHCSDQAQILPDGNACIDVVGLWYAMEVLVRGSLLSV